MFGLVARAGFEGDATERDRAEFGDGVDEELPPTGVHAIYGTRCCRGRAPVTA